MTTDESTAGARKDAAHMSRDWVVDRRLIAGVKVREVRSVVTANGITTELFRPWRDGPDSPDNR